MILSQKDVVFQPRLGSKTDNKGKKFIQSSIGFHHHQTWNLNIPKIVQHYISITEQQRNGQSALLVRPANQSQAASVASLRVWVKDRLVACGVHASAGSTRAATATASGLAGVPIADILKNGNWASQSSLRKHYFRP
jgi:hypothetical protein